MALDLNKEKIQELSIVINDRLQNVGRRWWIALGLVFVLCFPLYYTLRASFAQLLVRNHKFPALIYQAETKVPLEVTEKKIFKLSDGAYAGFFKIRNSANLNWGVTAQPYTAIFTTTGGTEVTRVVSTAFILPASEKIIVFKRFTTDKTPTILNVTLGATQFVHKPERAEAKLEIQRNDVALVDGNLVVSAAVKNNTPFTISRIDLPMLLYDRSNNVVAANFTSIDDVTYHETRTFQFIWTGNPTQIAPGDLRPEILPQVNIFDNNIYQLPAGSPQFDPVPTNP